MTGVSTAPDAPETAAPAPAARAFPVSAGRLALETASAAIAAWIFAGLLYRVWNLRWSVPINEGGADARGIAAQLKTIDETGWWVHNPKLGYPFGQYHADFPAGGESLQHLALKLLMWVTPGYGQTMNLYYLGGFGVLAAVTFLVIRHLRFAYPIALVLAIAYTFLPYHFAHAESHLHRSTYFTGPLACLLLLWALSWRTSFLRDPAGTRVRGNLRRGRVVAAVGLAVIIGISETMTTAFTMTLLGASAIVVAIRWREPQRLLVAAALIGVLLVSFIAVSAPTVIYIAKHGRNQWTAARQVPESERYALKLSRVIFPASHRLGAWARVGDKVQAGSLIPPDNGQYIGLLGVAGFLAGLIGLLGRGLRRRGPQDLRPPDDREALMDHASLLMILAVLVATVSGFSVLIALAGLDEVRTWGRMAVILAFLALVVFGLGWERLGARLAPRVGSAGRAIALLALPLAALVVWDEVTPQSAPAQYKANAATWVSDQRFVDAIDQRMPTGAAVFQLPVVPFPESPARFRMRDYDLYRGYIHDDGSLRWSYGAVKGRPIADWQLAIRDRIDPVRALPALLGLGYDGLWLDTYGYADGGADLAQRLVVTLHQQPLRSQNGRLLFYDLRPYKQRLGRTDAQLAAITRRQLGITPPTPLP